MIGKALRYLLITTYAKTEEALLFLGSLLLIILLIFCSLLLFLLSNDHFHDTKLRKSEWAVLRAQLVFPNHLDDSLTPRQHIART